MGRLLRPLCAFRITTPLLPQTLYRTLNQTMLCRTMNVLNQEPDPNVSRPLWWALLPAKELVRRLEKLHRADIVKCIGNLPHTHCPAYAQKSRRKCCAALVQHVQQRISRLQSLGDYMFLVNVLSVVPFAVPDTRESLLSLVLHLEHSTLLVNQCTRQD